MTTVADEGPTRRSATDQVFAQLREEIVSGRLEPGSRHSVYRLSDELGVSRTPVREAVLRLADLGLVVIEKNRGVRVRGVQVEDVRDVFELRLLLEVPVAAEAARSDDPALAAGLRETLAAMHEAADAGDTASFARLDRSLHAALGDAVGNARLSQEVDRLRDSIQVRGVATFGRTRSMRDVADEHEPIVAAVEAGDPAAAASAMRDHLVRTAALLIEQVGGAEAARAWERGRRIGQ